MATVIGIRGTRPAVSRQELQERLWRVTEPAGREVRALTPAELAVVRPLLAALRGRRP